MDRRTSRSDSERMPQLVDQRLQRVRHDRAVSWTPATALFWRLLVVNVLVFVAAAAVLVVSPATASEPVSVTVVTVLAVGLTLMLVVNALLVRASLRPLDGHTALMKHIDLRCPRERAQESLTNIARHADASRVELSLTGEREGVVQRITNDGRAIGGLGASAGIRGMRERAILIGAHLTLDARPAGGTKVCLVVPTQAQRG